VKTWIVASLLIPLMSAATAGEKTVYQQDKYGKTQYHKPSYSVRQDGRVIEVDTYGHKQYQKQQYQVKEGKVYSASPTGQIQYDKPHYSQEQNGQVIETDPYGNKQHHKPTYRVGSKTPVPVKALKTEGASNTTTVD